MTERDAEAGSGRTALRHGVLPLVLTRSAHHQEVTVAKLEPPAGPTALGAQEEAPTLPERHDGDERVHVGLDDAIAVPGHAVGSVAVEVAADGMQVHVALAEHTPDVVEPPGRVRTTLFPPPGEAGLGESALPHHHLPLTPWQPIDQLSEQVIGIGQPTGGVV